MLDRNGGLREVSQNQTSGNIAALFRDGLAQSGGSGTRYTDILFLDPALREWPG
jgi:hypothetical protein